jgi:hypothetical protein
MAGNGEAELMRSKSNASGFSNTINQKVLIRPSIQSYE